MAYADTKAHITLIILSYKYLKRSGEKVEIFKQIKEYFCKF